MAVIQAIIAFITKSAGRILNAIFGWAVVALFGRSSPKQQMMLTVLVGAAAVWPLLIAGVVFPKAMAFALAFVPYSSKLSTWAVRLVWILLALAVPIAVGLVVAGKAPPGSPREPFVKKVLRGVPITLGIASAFIVMFITVPALRIASAVRGRKDEHVPCITEGAGYNQAAKEIDVLLERYGIDAQQREPSWWLATPTRVLQKLGGKALRGYMPEKLAYWKGDDVEIALYPSDILIRGKNKHTAWMHGILAETLADGPGVMSFDAAAQDLERQIQRVWQADRDNPAALEVAMTEIARQIRALSVDWDDWQIVYRKALQLDRALRGEPQLLEGTVTRAELEQIGERPLATTPTTDLMKQVIGEASQLVRKEIELAKAEARADIKRELAAGKEIGAGAVCGLIGVTLLFVALTFGLANVMAGWAAALLVAGVVLAAGGGLAAYGWTRRVRQPLEKTQRSVKEGVRWAKERFV